MKSLWDIIPRNYRRRAIGVTATIFLRALLNFVGVAMLIPVLTLILDRENIASSRYMLEAYELLNIDSYDSFVVVVCVAVVAGLSLTVTEPRIVEVVTCAVVTATTRSSATVKSSRFIVTGFRDTIYVSG